MVLYNFIITSELIIVIITRLMCYHWEKLESLKYLRLHVDRRLQWNYHIERVASILKHVLRSRIEFQY